MFIHIYVVCESQALNTKVDQGQRRSASNVDLQPTTVQNCCSLLSSVQHSVYLFMHVMSCIICSLMKNWSRPPCPLSRSHWCSCCVCLFVDLCSLMLLVVCLLLCLFGCTYFTIRLLFSRSRWCSCRCWPCSGCPARCASGSGSRPRRSGRRWTPPRCLVCCICCLMISCYLMYCVVCMLLYAVCV